MIQELVYTSIENGLLPGSRGFCTVAMTEGTSEKSRMLLEALSGYAHVFTGHDANYLRNPVGYSHLRDNAETSILSRMAACEFDYTGRTNKLAHHILLDDKASLPSAGPAALMLTENMMMREWQGAPRILERGRVENLLPTVQRKIFHKATSWLATPVGAAGAAVLAKSFEVTRNASGDSTVYLCFGLGDDAPRNEHLLKLVDEALALLPDLLRWQVSFSTYFTALPIGMQCDWRCVLATDPGFLRQRAKAIWIDLASGAIHNAGHLDYSETQKIAESGVLPVGAKIAIAPKTIETRQEPARKHASSMPFRAASALASGNPGETFDVERYKLEHEAKIRRDNRAWGLALGAFVAVALLVTAGVLYKMDQTSQRAPITPEQSDVAVAVVTDEPVAQPMAPFPADSKPVVESQVEDNTLDQAEPPLEAAAEPESNASSTESTAETQKGVLQSFCLVESEDDVKDEAGWHSRAYFEDGKERTASSLYKKGKAGRRLPGDVIIFTNHLHGARYVLINDNEAKQDLATMFFDKLSRPITPNVAFPVKVDRNRSLFELLQSHVVTILTVSTDEVIRSDQGEKYVVAKKLEGCEIPLEVERMLSQGGCLWSTDLQDKFRKSAIGGTEEKEIEKYIDASPLHGTVDIECKPKRFSPAAKPVSLKLNYEDFKWFAEQKEILDKAKDEKGSGGKKSESGGKGPPVQQKTPPDPAQVRKTVVERIPGHHGLMSKDADDILEAVVKAEKEFKAQNEKDEEIRKNRIEGEKAKILLEIKLKNNLSVKHDLTPIKESGGGMGAETLPKRFR